MDDAVVNEYIKTMRRVSQVIDNMLLHFELELSKDEDEAFASEPVKESFVVTKNGPPKALRRAKPSSSRASGSVVVEEP
jgi:hypothetical protein